MDLFNVMDGMSFADTWAVTATSKQIATFISKKYKTVTTLILLLFKELYGLGSNWLSYYSVNYTIIQLIILLFSELYYYSVTYTIIQLIMVLFS